MERQKKKKKKSTNPAWARVAKSMMTAFRYRGLQIFQFFCQIQFVTAPTNYYCFSQVQSSDEFFALFRVKFLSIFFFFSFACYVILTK